MSHRGCRLRNRVGVFAWLITKWKVQFKWFPEADCFILLRDLCWTVNKDFCFWIRFGTSFLCVISVKDPIAESCCGFMSASVPLGDSSTTTCKLYNKLIGNGWFKAWKLANLFIWVNVIQAHPVVRDMDFTLQLQSKETGLRKEKKHFRLKTVKYKSRFTQ